MAWKTGQCRGEGTGWTPEQIQAQRTRTTNVMARKTFDVVVASHEALRRADVPVRITDHRRSRAAIVVSFNNHQATRIVASAATVRLERAEKGFLWYVIIEAGAFWQLCEKAGVAPEQLYGWQAGPPTGEPVPMPPLTDI